MDRSNWIRSICNEAAARPSTDRDLVNRVNMIDERAREVMVAVIERVARLELLSSNRGTMLTPSVRSDPDRHNDFLISHASAASEGSTGWASVVRLIWNQWTAVEIRKVHGCGSTADRALVLSP